MAQGSVHHGIVVGFDGSLRSGAAISWAARDAELRSAPLTIVHALPDPTAVAWLDIPVPEGYWNGRRDRGRDVLEDATRIALEALPAGRDITVHRELASDSPLAALVDRSKDAELVVVGCRGHGGVQRALLGSVSSGLIRHAHCPVAVIHDHRPPAVPLSTAPVIVGIDGSPASEDAVAIAFDEASRRGVELIALHTWLESSDDFISVGWRGVRERADEVLAERLAGWQERYPDVAVQRIVKMDNPADELLTLSESGQLVVVGSHGRGGIAGLVLGSASSTVAHCVRIPVIVARRA
ncbi:universal stress protein [Mycolicibacterium sp. CR10]|uniref:universal stress protein n=1 Tax=Mycolicibacterium sp. CR10 TaxID=2562314 RepID=UPI001485A820|nr:universal stress protein [Mycolicibacterium sp. CR10]